MRYIHYEGHLYNVAPNGSYVGGTGSRFDAAVVLTSNNYGHCRDSGSPATHCLEITTPVNFAMHLFNPLGVRSYCESPAVL